MKQTTPKKLTSGTSQTYTPIDPHCYFIQSYIGQILRTSLQGFVYRLNFKYMIGVERSDSGAVFKLHLNRGEDS